VQRERSDRDRRFVHVRLTAAGETLIREVFPRHADAVTTEMASLSSEEHRQLARLCRRLVGTTGPAAGD
jgi:MarR family 2-MHQ and catechol resistance regulon transcriptional repressor